MYKTLGDGFLEGYPQVTVQHAKYGCGPGFWYLCLCLSGGILDVANIHENANFSKIAIEHLFS